jgi:hypothetical protein
MLQYPQGRPFSDGPWTIGAVHFLLQKRQPSEAGRIWTRGGLQALVLAKDKTRRTPFPIAKKPHCCWKLISALNGEPPPMPSHSPNSRNAPNSLNPLNSPNSHCFSRTTVSSAVWPPGSA